uniref:Acyltransferase n=1 Tax=Globodera rostochiensis TaxID=31243 RepID=A0A914IFM4_GLORO
MDYTTTLCAVDTNPFQFHSGTSQRTASHKFEMDFAYTKCLHFRVRVVPFCCHGGQTFVYIYMNTVRMLLIYLLLAERTLATVFFRKYFELYGRLWLNIVCVIVLSSLSYAIQVTQKSSPHDFDDSTMISIILLFALQIFAIMIFMYIYLQNKANYKSNKVLTLNQRFQLSENIRTLKQLGPTFVLYTLTVVLIYGIKFLFIFGWVVNDAPTKIAFMFQTLLLSCVNIGIELTVITHHPMLKRKAIQLKKCAEIGTNFNYLFCVHPHGSCPCTSAIVFGSNGMISYDRESIKYVLSRPEKGNAVALVVGGNFISYFVNGLNQHFFSTYKVLFGWLLSTVRHLCPFTFLERQIFAIIRLYEESRNLKAFLSDGTRTFGLLPHRRRIVTVVGAPIEIEQNPEPSETYVSQVHAKYCFKLLELFNTHKTTVGGLEDDVELEFI